MLAGWNIGVDRLQSNTADALRHVAVVVIEVVDRPALSAQRSNRGGLLVNLVL
jgi:hypothetical protein